MLTRRSAILLASSFTLLAGSTIDVLAQNAVTLRGAGSTFAAPLWKKWGEEYGVTHRNVAISYDAVGSGEGVKRFLAATVDFAGSDEILSESEIAKVTGAVTLPITAGMIAMSRVMRRRSQAGSRMLRKPSITIWPASVPVMVEFCPEASRATANSVLAAVVPRSGARRR